MFDTKDLNKKVDMQKEAKREKIGVRYDLVPYREISDSYMRVSEFGAIKYAPWNWTAGSGLPLAQLVASTARHLFALMRGEDFDKESGLHHADHLLWNAVAIVHNIEHKLPDERRAEPPRHYYKSGETK